MDDATLLELHRRFHTKVGCPGAGACYVCDAETELRETQLKCGACDGEGRAEEAQAEVARLTNVLMRIRDERGVRPYYIAREALKAAAEQPAAAKENEGVDDGKSRQA